MKTTARSSFGSTQKAVEAAPPQKNSPVVPGTPDLSAVVVEPNQRAWTSSLGRIWVQTPQEPARWTNAWEDSRWRVPIVSLFSDGRRVIGVAADMSTVPPSVIQGLEAALK